jgi:hypothetical protein
MRIAQNGTAIKPRSSKKFRSNFLTSFVKKQNEAKKWLCWLTLIVCVDEMGCAVGTKNFFA